MTTKEETNKVAILSLRPIETFCSLDIGTQSIGMKTSYGLEPFLKYEIVVCRFAVGATQYVISWRHQGMQVGKNNAGSIVSQKLHFTS